MIEFKGQISDKTMGLVRRKSKLHMVFLFLLAFSVVWPVVRVIYPAADLLLGILLGIVCVGFPFLYPTKKGFAQELPHRIYIKNKIITAENDHFRDAMTVEKVKKVIDYGECYAMSSDGLTLLSHFIFDKSLISQGTLEEFEQMFEGKIVRKGPKKKKENA